MPEHQQPEIKATPEAAQFANTLTQAFDLEHAERLLASGTARALRDIIDNLSSPFMSDELAKFMGGAPKQPDTHTLPDSLHTMAGLLEIARWTNFWMVKYDFDRQGMPATAAERHSMLQKLVPIFGSGSETVVSQRLNAANQGQPRSETDKFIGMGFLHAAAYAIECIARRNYGEAAAQSVIDREVDMKLQVICAGITLGLQTKPSPGSPESTVLGGSINGLAVSYRRDKSEDFKDAFVLLVVPLKLGPEIYNLANAPLSRYQEVMQARGITGYRPEEFRETVRLAAKQRATYARRVELMQAQAIDSYFTRKLVEHIANGDIIYSEAVKLGSRPLEQRLHELAAEERRMTDAGFITLELDLDPNDELGGVVLREGSGQPGRAPSGTAAEQIAAAAEVSRIEPYRVYTLVQLRNMIPGSKIRFRLLSRGRSAAPVQPPEESDKAKKPIKVTDTERYLVLFLPDGSFVAEFPEPDHATLVFRAETGMQPDAPYTRSEVLDANITDAVQRYGAVRVEHPRREDLERDRRGTVQRFIDLLLEDLTVPLAPGEHLPDRLRLRRLRRLGTGAIQS